jgi:hypothetical protein
MKKLISASLLSFAFSVLVTSATALAAVNLQKGVTAGSVCALCHFPNHPPNASLAWLHRCRHEVPQEPGSLVSGAPGSPLPLTPKALSLSVSNQTKHDRTGKRWGSERKLPMLTELQ